MSAYDSRGSNRGDSGDGRSVSGDEVKKLLKKAPFDYKVISDLRSKYKDEDLVQKYFEAYKEEREHIEKRARKFRNVIMMKYAGQGLSFPDLIKKAKKYARKYKITDDEFDVFLKTSLADPTINKTNIYN